MGVLCNKEIYVLNLMHITLAAVCCVDQELNVRYAV